MCEQASLAQCQHPFFVKTKVTHYYCQFLRKCPVINLPNVSLFIGFTLWNMKPHLFCIQHAFWVQLILKPVCFFMVLPDPNKPTLTPENHLVEYGKSKKQPRSGLDALWDIIEHTFAQTPSTTGTYHAPSIHLLVWVSRVLCFWMHRVLLTALKHPACPSHWLLKHFIAPPHLRLKAYFI